MKFYKGLKRLYNTTDLELSKSDKQNRYIKVQGITDISELYHCIIPITSKFEGTSIEETKDSLIPVTFIIENETAEELTSQTIDLPIDWVTINQVYNLYISDSGDIVPFGANIESLLSSGVNDGYLRLPSAVTSINETYTAEQILEAFGGEENMNAFKDAVENKRPILFYQDSIVEKDEEGNIIKSTRDYMDISVITSYNPGTWDSISYVKQDGTQTLMNLYGVYRITTIGLSTVSLESTNILNLAFGHKDEDKVGTNFTHGISTRNIININRIREDVTSLQNSVSKLAGSVSDQVPVGTGLDYYGINPPENYMFADGSEISRTEYAELFAVIGTLYGVGDGSTTFNLPDKREAVTIMKGTTYATLGQSTGANTKTIAKENIPNYDLTVTDPGHTHSGVAKTTLLCSSGNTDTDPKASNTAGSTGSAKTGITVNSGGSGTAFNVMQKSLVCNYIIKVKSSTSISEVLEGEY